MLSSNPRHYITLHYHKTFVALNFLCIFWKLKFVKWNVFLIFFQKSYLQLTIWRFSTYSISLQNEKSTTLLFFEKTLHMLSCLFQFELKLSDTGHHDTDKWTAFKVSPSPNLLTLVDFAIGLVIFVLNLPYWQVLFRGEIQITEGL